MLDLFLCCYAAGTGQYRWTAGGMELREEFSLVYALYRIVSPRIHQSDTEDFQSLLTDVFPHAASILQEVEDKEEEECLVNAIEEVMKQQSLHFSRDFLLKVNCGCLVPANGSLLE